MVLQLTPCKLDYKSVRIGGLGFEDNSAPLLAGEPDDRMEKKNMNFTERSNGARLLHSENNTSQCFGKFHLLPRFFSCSSSSCIELLPMDLSVTKLLFWYTSQRSTLQNDNLAQSTLEPGVSHIDLCTQADAHDNIIRNSTAIAAWLMTSTNKVNSSLWLRTNTGALIYTRA
eukprot:616666-Amphidinium_carterae.1